MIIFHSDEVNQSIMQAAWHSMISLFQQVACAKRWSSQSYNIDCYCWSAALLDMHMQGQGAGTSMALYVKGAAQNSSSGSSSSSMGATLRLSLGFISLVYVSAIEGAMERPACRQ